MVWLLPKPVESTVMFGPNTFCWQKTEAFVSWQGMMHRGHKGADDYAAQQQVLQEHLMQVQNMK